jgi:hypothetical protein
MGSGTLLEKQIEAGERFVREFHMYAPVRAAFWVKDDEASEPWLYVASDQIMDDNFDVGYEEVGRISDELQDPWFDLNRVKLISATGPECGAVTGARVDLVKVRPTLPHG